MRKIAFIIVVGLVMAVPASPASAGEPIVYEVATNVDRVAADGAMSLREAVTLANRHPGDDVISLRPGGRYSLTLCGAGDEDANISGDLDFTDTTGGVLIDVGDGPVWNPFWGGPPSGLLDDEPQPAIIEQYCPGERVLHQTAVGREEGPITYLALDDVVVWGGQASGDGGGILSQSSVGATNSTINGNRATGSGGGIYSRQTVVLTRSNVRQNTASQNGGGIWADFVDANESSISDSRAGSNGGGIYAGSVADMSLSTLSGNRAGGMGGGVYAGYGALAHTSTVSGNLAGWSAGGMSAWTGMGVFHSTVVNNSVQRQGMAANLSTKNLAIVASVVARPGGGRSCIISTGTISDGYNFDEDGTCRLGGDLTSRSGGGDPRLDPLADNGGRTLTHMPAKGSPLVDFIPIIEDHRWFLEPPCAFRFFWGALIGFPDQRGIARPRNGACDVGSVER